MTRRVLPILVLVAAALVAALWWLADLAPFAVQVGRAARDSPSGSPAGEASRDAPGLAAAPARPNGAAPAEAAPPQPKAEITGVVLARDGKPCAHAYLSARIDGGRWGLSDPRALATTDEEGRFVLQALSPATTYAVEAHRGDDAAEVKATAGGQPVTIRLKAPAPPEARPVAKPAEPPYAIRGRVVDTDGKAVAGAEVRVAIGPRFGEASPSDVSDGKGMFLVRTSGPGRSRRLYARPPGNRDLAANSPTVEAMTGENDVVLVVDLGVELSVQADHAGDGQRLTAFAQRETAPGEESAPLLEASSRGDGRAQFDGLRRDAAYTVFVRSDDGALCGRVFGVRATAGRVTVALGPSLSIEGRLVADGPFTCEDVTAISRAVYLTARLKRDRTFRIDGLPVGRHTVVAIGEILTNGPGSNATALAHVEAGGRVDLRLVLWNAPEDAAPLRR